MRRIHSWRLFQKPERNYHLLSYRLTDTARRMNELNERRREIQRSLAEVAGDIPICATCGACCKGDYDHHTAVDFLVRSFSDSPLKGYGSIWRPKSLHTMVLDSLRPPSNISGSGGRKAHLEHLEGCPELGPKGCNIPVEDRPIRCVLWTCRAFRDALPDAKLHKIGQLNRELENISREVMRVLCTGR